ncbi:hypothetical protein [Ligilactobacillus ruminis]|uniref:hypothetical protein n=1 Tax=Ligilactobacillus ruminis TaxID=1623 RepID=UPI0034A533B5
MHGNENRLIFIMEGDRPAYKKTGSDLQLIANLIRFFGSILNGVDDDFSTPFFVFTKYLRNAIK